MALRLRGQQSSGTITADDLAADELALVLRSLADPAAFAPLYERYADYIFGYCWRRLGHRESAQDLTSLTFHKAIEHLHQFHGGSFKAWLFAIAENALRDYARTAHPTTAIEEGAELRSSEPSPEDQAIAVIQAEQLRGAIEQLPAEWRAVVEMRLERMSCAEVAAALGSGRTPEWVRQIHHRAVERLGKTLREESSREGAAR